MDIQSKNQIEEIIRVNKIVIFMKGTKEIPACSFSNQVIQIFNTFNVDYQTIDVLKDSNLRQNIKEYSQWPTIPQIYINKEFIGGADIISNLYKQSQLKEIIEKAINS
uniref:Glutaredoxin n=1 Tax=Rhodogorgon sp. TaxID=2485824 RepID=A0A3G3MI91_9FLOR|nr:glutaredoxin-like protein [Rhodogorgon sp.]